MSTPQVDALTTLVLSSGGAKGIHFGGVIQALSDEGILRRFRRFVGTSVGALVALALSLSFSAEEIIRFCYTLDMSDFLLHQSDYVAQASTFYKSYGLHETDVLEAFIRNMVQQKAELESLTFEQLFDLFGNDLCVTTCCVNTGRTHYLSRETGHGDMPVVKAVLMSCAIPLLFCPVVYHDELYVDGATFGHGVPRNTSTWMDHELPAESLQNHHAAAAITVRLLDRACREQKHAHISGVWEFVRRMAWGFVSSHAGNTSDGHFVDIFTDIQPLMNHITESTRRVAMQLAYDITVQRLEEWNMRTNHSTQKKITNCTAKHNHFQVMLYKSGSP